MNPRRQRARRAVLHVRLLPEELEAVRQEARRQGWFVSQWVRVRLLRGLKPVTK